jgi:hypothetical protein
VQATCVLKIKQLKAQSGAYFSILIAQLCMLIASEESSPFKIERYILGNGEISADAIGKIAIGIGSKKTN